MALQPSSRPAGSSQVLRYTGTITLGNTTLAQFPKANGVAPSDIAANTVTGVRFLLADATDLTDLTKQLPSTCFDDNQPAGAAPHAPTTGAIANITTATDQIITDRTWCQNTYVTVQPRTAAAAAALVGVDLGSVEFVLDTGADSGLGLDSGLPVLILPIISANAFGAYVAPDVDILVEVRHSASR